MEDICDLWTNLFNQRKKEVKPSPDKSMTHTPETIAKIRESNKRTWAKKKLESQKNP